MPETFEILARFLDRAEHRHEVEGRQLPAPSEEFALKLRRFAQGTNVVVLESDVAKVFPSAKAVNSSLRALAGIIRQREKALAAK